MTQLDSLIGALVPLSNYDIVSKDSVKNKPVFKIEFIGEEPFIKVVDNNRKGLNSADQKIFDEIKRLSHSNDFFGMEENNSMKVSLWDAPYLLNMLRNSVIKGKNKNLTFVDLPNNLMLKISTSEKSDDAHLKMIFRIGEEEYENFMFLGETNIYCNDTVYEVSSVGANFRHIKSLIASVKKKDLESYLTIFLSYVNNITPELNGTPAKWINTPEQSIPTLFLEKVAVDKALYLRTGLSIDSLPESFPEKITPVLTASVDDRSGIIVRPVELCDIENLTDALDGIIQKNAPNHKAKKEIYRDGNFFIIPAETAGPFLLFSLPDVLQNFRLVGSEKLKEYKVVSVFPKLKLKLSPGIDFLEGTSDIIIGEETFTIADILNQYAKKRYVQLSDGNRGIIDGAYIARLQRLFRNRDKKGRIRVDIFNLNEVEELLQSKLEGEVANHSRSVLNGFNNIKKLRKPKFKVDAVLRPYQIEGVKWLKYLYDNKLGGCLADDMGLGKTLQTTALLSIIYPSAKRPSLIVMPRSLLFNWEKELSRFAPSLTFSTYYGTGRNLENAMKSQVVLTTYAMVRNDIMNLKDHKFQCVILDESQNIKNFSSQTTLAVQLLDSEHRLALSGTPMENNLTEIYSLFRFLNPTMFGSIENFNSSFTYPIQKYGDKAASHCLRRKIYPFILRRLKKDVLVDLPDRINLTRYVEMSERQKKLYEERRISYKKQIEEAIASEGVNKSQFLIFQALNELRRIASVPEYLSDGTIPSPKIEELMQLLSESISNQHKSVVFFNFLSGLEIVMKRLEDMGVEFETMTGSTSAGERKRIVERFQSDPECKVMLLTLKVGGVGLNLTAADMVYIFEPWWNKAVEEQAINRLHRIGQRSVVNAFSLITVDTIEEKILQLQEQKSELFNELIGADNSSSKHLSEKDIDFILS